jgi:hypothetical protein
MNKNITGTAPDFAAFFTKKFRSSEPFLGVMPPFLSPDMDGTSDGLKPAVWNPGLQSVPRNPIVVGPGKIQLGSNEMQTFRRPNPGGAAVINTGLGFIENLSRDEDADDLAVFRTDRYATLVTGNRGDYTQNEGFFKPDQYTPTQFRGQAEMGMDFTQGMSLIPENLSVNYDTVDLEADKALMGMRSIPTTLEDMVATMPEEIRADAPAAKERAAVSIKLKGRMMDRAKAAYEYYVQQKGLPPHVAAGIVGNLAHESGMNPMIHESGNTGEGRALAQWGVNARYKDLQAWAKAKGRDVNDMYTQLDFILEEPGWSKKALDAMSKTKTPEEAAMAFAQKYERPNEKFAHYDKRQAYARQLLPEMNDGGEVPDLYSVVNAVDVEGDPEKPKKPAPAPARPPVWSDDIYKANAAMLYYKETLNKKLREKDPAAYDNYMKRLGELRKMASAEEVQKFVQENDFNTYLSPEDVRSTLGDKYENYLSSIDVINKNNLKYNRPRLYGEIEGEQQLDQLNYGRRFASLPVNPSFVVNDNGRMYERNYIFNPDTGKVGYVEKGDVQLRPRY